MKKFIISLIMAIVAVLTTTSCHHHVDDNVDQSWFTAEDSMAIARIAQNAVAQKGVVFDDATQVLDHLYYLSLTEEVQQMDPNIIVIICSVLHDLEKDITMQNIVKEYDLHHDIFNNLPPDKLNSLATGIITDDGSNTSSSDSMALLDYRAKNKLDSINEPTSRIRQKALK